MKNNTFTRRTPTRDSGVYSTVGDNSKAGTMSCGLQSSKAQLRIMVHDNPLTSCSARKNKKPATTPLALSSRTLEFDTRVNDRFY